METILKRWFRNSETLLLARLQVAIGFLFSLVSLICWLFFDPTTQVALQALIPARYWPYILIGMGLVGEYLRRRRDPDMH